MKPYTKRNGRLAQRSGRIASHNARSSVPDDVVNRAWKSLVVANLMMATGDEMRYSSANIYARLFEAESGDALRSLLTFGLQDDAKRMVDPLLAYAQEGLRYHDAAFKLQMLAHVYWITRDADFVRSRAKQWRPSVNIILKEREKEKGYCQRRITAATSRRKYIC